MLPFFFSLLLTSIFVFFKYILIFFRSFQENKKNNQSHILLCEKESVEVNGKETQNQKQYTSEQTGGINCVEKISLF